MFNKFINSQNGKIISKLMAVMIVVTLTFTNFIFLFSSMYKGIISYAQEIDLSKQNNQTNDENVSFDVYLSNAQTNVNTITSDINSQDVKLYISINVQNGGYMQGTEVELIDANFGIKGNEDVRKFSLKPIQSGSARTEEIPVVALKEDTFNVNLLNKISQIKLTGTYINNNGEEIAIDTTKGVQINWTAENITEGNEPIQLSEEIITNKIYNINGENKRIVQTLITSGIQNNIYPISKTEIEINIPTLSEENIYPEAAFVASTGTTATNGKSSIEFGENNWEYNEEEHKIYIQVQNQADVNNNINWNKGGHDKFIVTYIYNETVDVLQLGLTTNSKITLYDATNKLLTKESTQNLENIEEKTGIFSLEAIPTNLVYKGNMKLGQETEFETIWKVGVNYTGLNATLQVSNTVDTLNIEGNEVSYYKETYINKAEFIKILGEQGILEIYNGETLVSKITGETETNEVGDFQINYEGNIETIKILTTAPVEEGILNITHKKALKPQGDITNINLLTTNVKLESTETITDIGEMQIANTQTKIELGIENNRLSTTQVNNLNITVTLKTNDIKYSLYENPLIEIVLPQEIKNVELLEDSNIQVLNGNGLSFASKTIEENEGYKILKIQLEGTQEEYNQINTQIAINMEVSAKDLTPTINRTIQAKITNGLEIGEDEKTITFVAEEGLLLATAALNADNQSVGVKSLKNKLQIVDLPQNSETPTNITIQGTIVNNNTETINPVVIGSISNETSNIPAVLSSQIKVDNATVYYTQDEQVNQASGWSETYTQTATGYKIEFNAGLGVAETTIFEFDVQLPVQIDSNHNIDFSYFVYNGINVAEAPTISLATPKETKLELTVEPSVPEGETVYTGQEITYVVKVKNIGTAKAEEVQISCENSNGTIGEPKPVMKTIEKGETITETITIKINDSIEANQITTKVKVSAKNLQQPLEKQITNNVERALINMAIEETFKDGQLNYEKGQLGFDVIIENISGTTLNDVQVKTKLPEDTTHLEDDAIVVVMEEKEPGEDEMYGGDIVEKDIQREQNGNEIIYTISDLKANEIIKTILVVTADKFDENDGYEKEVIYEAETQIEGNKPYKVKQTDKIVKPNLTLTHTAINQTDIKRTEYVEPGDILEYTTTLTNNSDYEQNILLKGIIPEGLELISMNYTTKEQVEELAYENYEIELLLQGKESIELKSTAKVENKQSEQDYIINNTVEGSAKIFARKGADEPIYSNIISKTIEYRIKGTAVIEEPEDPIEPENPVEKTYKISGLAWLDQNEDGKIDENEEKLKDIVVKIKDSTTDKYLEKDGQAIQTTTNELGQYEFLELPVGKYMVIFEYNTKTYSLTKANGESVATITTTSEGNVVKTNIIEIKNADINNVNIGLVLNPEFDLQLDKYISKVTVQSNNESIVYNYENTQLAKIEIPAKNMKGSTIIIEYTIKVTNNGAVPGYAKNIVDYLSEELTFNSELNKNWYQDNDKNLYSVELANTEIQTEESKEIKLILTKTMQDDATVLINNTAEIYEDYNEYALEDINSTPANADEKENDMSPADILITIKTGGPVLYIGIVIASMLILGGGIYLINKKVLQKRFI